MIAGTKAQTVIAIMKHHLNYGNTVSESHMAAANMG
jgi:hypothetical protein